MLKYITLLTEKSSRFFWRYAQEEKSFDNGKAESGLEEKPKSSILKRRFG